MADVKEWIEEWCLIYPPKVKWNGVAIRSKPTECLKKMERFCKEHPDYTKDIIFDATKRYIDEKERENFEYTKRATYFIYKQEHGSLLESYCNDVLDDLNGEYEIEEQFNSNLV
jgi:hypothetical protein